jgi:hypothetical protein
VVWVSRVWFWAGGKEVPFLGYRLVVLLSFALLRSVLS